MKKRPKKPLSEAERERRRQQRLVALQQVKRQGYNVAEWCVAFGRSRATAYKMMAEGTLRYVEFGGRRFIPNEAAEELLRGATSDSPT